MMAHRAPSSSITYKWTYDTFLSFHGEDTRLGFISHLYNSLHQSGIHAFLDDEFIRTGENITPALFRAIQESRIAIIVFSENYANSTFCLRELEKILECFKKERRLIYPVFYYVDPSELRRPRGSYAEALARLEERFKDNRQQVDSWRQALSQAANFKGCHLKPRIANEQECITRITNEVAVRINQKPLSVTSYPVGLVSRVKDVISCLDLWSIEEIKMIGIWGAGGIGKSTIARAVYNSIADNFEGLCFLSDVRKLSKKPNGLTHLQKTILSKLVMEEGVKLSDYHEGIPIIKHRLSQKKVLLILDDVDESDQLKALAGRYDWFGSGSRIIITTRNKQLLVSHDVKSIYDVKGFNDAESLELLSWFAFKKENVDSNYMEVSNRAIHYSCGFPLALEVIGSNLRGKGVKHWSSALDQFQRIPHGRVLDALELSYDTLGEVEKQTFLDLACFFNGEKLAYIIDILQFVRGIQLEFAIEMLIDKSLIKIERGCVVMHDLIEDVGKVIVRRESSYEPGKRSRLWFYQDILHVLQRDTGTDKVEAIILDLPESEEVQWSGEAFMKMKNLKMLVIRKARFSECPKYLPNSLKWLEWKGYPFSFFPYLCPTELVHCDLSQSYFELFQPFDKKFQHIICMNLRNCKFLRQIPDLSGASNLRELWLDGCTSLIEIHDSVGCSHKLREFSAMRCKNLKILPSCLRLRSLEHLNLFSCSSLQRFPEILVMMEKLQTLDLDKTGITELPFSICNLVGLETLNVEECPNLKQLPASICTLPNLRKLTADLSEGMSHFNMSEGGDEASLDSAKSVKLEEFRFSNCNLSDDSLAFCLSHFRHMMHLDLSFNNFTVLPECIKEYHNLKYLLLDNCNQLQHIGGMPPNLERFSAICCTSLTKFSKTKVLIQAFNFQPGKRNFILPGKEFPERLHSYSRGSFTSFWVRNVFPTIFLWILIKDDLDYVYNCKFSVHVNEIKLDISSKWLLQPTIKTDHIYICDLLSIIHSAEFPLGNKWNQVKVSIEGKTQEIKSKKEIYFGVHVYDLQSNLENIQFMDPRIYSSHYLLQEIQEDWKEVEEVMNLDSNSTKSAKTSQPQDRGEIEDSMQQGLDSVKYAKSPEITSSQEVDIINNKLQPDWDDFGILKVGGYEGTIYPTWSSGGCSYDNLIELCLTKCNNCRKIPTLGQLPALRSLTIETLQSVVFVGSEFLKAPDSASLVLPFPSLETLNFENMISWKKWHSIGMKAFPKLRALRFLNCPELVGHLPRQLVSLECLEINGCPLLASSTPKYPKIQELHIIASQKVVLKGQELPPSLHLLAISDARMLEPVSENLHIKDLFVQGCSDVVPLGVIRMPPLVEGLHITDCENLMFVSISKALPLFHLRRISICNCKFLTSLLDDMESLLPNLKELSIEGCPEMEPFSLQYLPSKLEGLEIRNCDKLLSSRTEWQRLPNIIWLIISTKSQTLHCYGLERIPSLQQLQILNSPNLEKIEGGIMPPSLAFLEISHPCLLSERCRKKDKEIWPKISHVPFLSLKCRDAKRGRDITIDISNSRSEIEPGLMGKVVHLWKSSLSKLK